MASRGNLQKLQFSTVKEDGFAGAQSNGTNNKQWNNDTIFGASFPRFS